MSSGSINIVLWKKGAPLMSSLQWLPFIFGRVMPFRGTSCPSIVFVTVYIRRPHRWDRRQLWVKVLHLCQNRLKVGNVHWSGVYCDRPLIFYVLKPFGGPICFTNTFVILIVKLRTLGAILIRSAPFPQKLIVFLLYLPVTLAYPPLNYTTNLPNYSSFIV